LFTLARVVVNLKYYLNVRTEFDCFVIVSILYQLDYFKPVEHILLRTMRIKGNNSFYISILSDRLVFPFTTFKNNQYQH